MSPRIRAWLVGWVVAAVLVASPCGLAALRADDVAADGETAVDGATDSNAKAADGGEAGQPSAADASGLATTADSSREVDFVRDVQPILNRYCAGCHGPDTSESELRLDSFDRLRAGGERGSAVKAGDADGSLMIQLITGAMEPMMPPDGEPRPEAAEIELLRRWIASGAAGPAEVDTGDHPPAVDLEAALRGKPRPITALAVHGPTRRWARGDIGRVVMGPLQPDSPTAESAASASDATTNLVSGDAESDDNATIIVQGKVTGLAFNDAGDRLWVASGWAGSAGEVSVWDVSGSTPARVDSWSDHDDAIYGMVVSGDQRWLATAGYDRRIVVRDIAAGKVRHVLEGHNGAVFDLAFSPDSSVLASASADSTVKVWSVASGTRLDTMSQPLKEQLSVDISSDGRWVIAAGEDNRIRLWELVSTSRPAINPLHVARFAHEASIHRVRFSRDGRFVVSVSADQAVKIWNVPDLRLVGQFPAQPASTQVLAVSDDTGWVAVGRMDGTSATYPWPTDLAAASTTSVASGGVSAQLRRDVDEHGGEATADIDPAAGADEFVARDEEPNDEIAEAVRVKLPMRAEGTIDGSDGAAGRQDRDLYRFHAQAGEQWVMEVIAERDKSPLDSVITIWTAEGRPVPRVLLRAVRDSYFTFRGKDSVGTGDFRLHNWEEMRLNQYLYANGEVVKLYHYPRGPDSGFNVYPNFGNRHTYFGTTALAHALNEPCYIVEPHQPGEQLVANGLPVFEIPYENDDASDRRLGPDSLLMFTAPETGEYMIVVRDVRGHGGPDYTYRLEARRPNPSFRMRMESNDRKIAPGSGVRFGVVIDRTDGLDDEPVEVTFGDVPEGVRLAGPLVIEPGHLRAWGTLFVDEAAAERLASEPLRVPVRAEARVGGRLVIQEDLELGPFELDRGKSPLRVWLGPSEPVREGEQPETGTAASGDSFEIVVVPGRTTTAEVRMERGGVGGPVGFGSEEAVWNLPHGVYVDNTGLNGVLIPEGETSRTVYLTAEPWVETCERWVFIEALVEGKPTSAPVRLRVQAAGSSH